MIRHIKCLGNNVLVEASYPTGADTVIPRLKHHVGNDDSRINGCRIVTVLTDPRIVCISADKQYCRSIKSIGRDFSYYVYRFFTLNNDNSLRLTVRRSRCNLTSAKNALKMFFFNLSF